jgi:uncharacterized membrane protein (UPF0127 family)
MTRSRPVRGGLAVLALAGCHDHAAAGNQVISRARTQVTIGSTNGVHYFAVEMARDAAAQERGLMYRTDIADDGGMLFAPYPPDGGPPQRASFWMHDTPTPLDIIFIRPDHTIARIAENAVPFDETPIRSEEAVIAVLELKGGRASALGIRQGDRVDWND